MFKAIANQKVEISQEEYDYYLELEKVFGKEAFLDLFKVNDKGQIISVLPPAQNPTAMVLIFYLLNVMFNQRLRKLDGWMEKVDKEIEFLRKRIDENTGVDL